MGRFLRDYAVPLTLLATAGVFTGGVVADGMGAFGGTHEATVTVDHHRSVLVKGVRYLSLDGTDAAGKHVRFLVSRQQYEQATDGAKFHVVVQRRVLFLDGLTSMDPAP